MRVKKLTLATCVLECASHLALSFRYSSELGIFLESGPWNLDVSITRRPPCLHAQCTLSVPKLYPTPAYASLCQPNQAKQHPRAKHPHCHHPNHFTENYKLLSISSLLQLKTQNSTFKIDEKALKIVSKLRAFRHRATVYRRCRFFLGICARKTYIPLFILWKPRNDLSKKTRLPKRMI